METLLEILFGIKLLLILVLLTQKHKMEVLFLYQDTEFQLNVMPTVLHLDLVKMLFKLLVLLIMFGDVLPLFVI